MQLNYSHFFTFFLLVSSNPTVSVFNFSPRVQVDHYLLVHTDSWDRHLGYVFSLKGTAHERFLLAGEQRNFHAKK